MPADTFNGVIPLRVNKLKNKYALIRFSAVYKLCITIRGNKKRPSTRVTQLNLI